MPARSHGSAPPSTSAAAPRTAPATVGTGRQPAVALRALAGRATAADIYALQRTVGNRAVQRLLASNAVVRKATAPPITARPPSAVLQRSSKDDGQQTDDNAAAAALVRDALGQILAALKGQQVQPNVVENVQDQMDVGMDEEDQPRVVQTGRASDLHLQRAATATGYGGGTFNNGAAQPGAGVVGSTANATLTFGTVTGANTSTTVDADDLFDQPSGTGVGTTRPNQWAQFIALAGGNNIFKQGHTLHQDLGGDGTHDNLSPFTASLNQMHYHRAEKHVIWQTDNSIGGEFADYDVDVNYNGNPGIAAWAINQFNGMSLANRNGAMVAAGIITALQAAGNIVGGAIPPLQVTAAHTWLTNYVNATFPTDIDCTAVFMDSAPLGGYTASNAQQINITNDF